MAKQGRVFIIWHIAHHRAIGYDTWHYVVFSEPMHYDKHSSIYLLAHDINQ